MPLLDLSANPRLPVLMELVTELSCATQPGEVMRILAGRMTQLGEAQGYLGLSIRDLPPGRYKITRQLVDLTDPVLLRALDHDPWREWDRLETLQGGLLGELIATPTPKVIHELRAESDPVLGNLLARYGSLIAVPLFDHGRPLNWSVMLSADPHGFSPQTLEEMVLRGNLAGGTVRHLLMARELREANERIREEMRRIALIQQALLPTALPEVPRLHLAASYQTYDSAGGDFYDVRPVPALSSLAPSPRNAPLGASASTPPGAASPDAAPLGAVDPRWALLIADASGHGPAAATVIAMLSAIFSTFPGIPRGPAEVLAYLNHHLCAKRIEATFVTAFLAFFDPLTLRLTYARAGHPPPLLKHPGQEGPVQVLDQVGTYPLGIDRAADFEDHTLTLYPRQTLLMFTDGVTEALSPQGAFFGVEGVAAALADCVGEPHCVMESVRQSLLDHEAGRRPSDDQTLLAAQVEEG